MSNSQLRTVELPLDLYESDDRFTLLARLPGVRPEDLEVRLEGDHLHLRATRPEPVPASDEARPVRPLFRELSGLQWTRSLRLRTPIEAERVDARLEAGLLRLELPKAAAARPRTIEVRAG